MQRILLSLAVLLGITAARWRKGSCPTPKLQENFDAVKYMGKWHEQFRDSEFEFSPSDAECAVAEYSLNDDGSIKVHNSQYLTSEHKLDDINGKAKCDGAQCGVKFYWYQPPGDYRVVSTNYDEYTLVYSCNDLFGLFKIENMWILTREQELEPSRLDEIKGMALDAVDGYKEEFLRHTIQGPAC